MVNFTVRRKIYNIKNQYQRLWGQPLMNEINKISPEFNNFLFNISVDFLFHKELLQWKETTLILILKENIVDFYWERVALYVIPD